LSFVSDWMFGHLSAQGRVWSALAPALFVATYFVITFLVYLVRVAVKGQYHDAEIEARGSSLLAGMFFRQWFGWVMQPAWKLVVRSGVPATAITTLSVLLATAAGVSTSTGRFALGGWLYIFAGMCDFLDGRLARATKTVSPAGAALDSILDRYSDSAVLVGLAWYYRDSWVLIATQLALVGSSIIPYIRARGEAIGVSLKEVGLMQRAERVMYLGVAVAMSPVLEVAINADEPHPLHRLAIVGVVLLAVSTQITALQRFIHLITTLDPRAWDLGWLRGDPASRRRRRIGAMLATSADFIVMFVLVESHGASVPVATFVGLVVGASLAYAANKLWTFGPLDARYRLAGRYVFAALTSALLNAGGMAVLMLLPHVMAVPFLYVLPWVAVHITVFMAWNFPLYQAAFLKLDEASGGDSPA
jgi:phosphatidylglycerophosphate synthase/putative flippase GtrA